MLWQLVLAQRSALFITSPSRRCSKSDAAGIIVMTMVLIPTHSAGRQSSWFSVTEAQERGLLYRYFRSWLLNRNYSIWTHNKTACSGLAYLQRCEALVRGSGVTGHLAACFIKVARGSILKKPA